MNLPGSPRQHMIDFLATVSNRVSAKQRETNGNSPQSKFPTDLAGWKTHYAAFTTTRLAEEMKSYSC